MVNPQITDAVEAEPPPPPPSPSIQPPAADSEPSPWIRPQADTARMSVLSAVGPPPALPATPAPSTAEVEDPTFMPGPREVPAGGSPDDPALPPGRVPKGDSRSLRKRAERYEFVLIYRAGTFVISRFGVVGTRGQWRVVEYPTSAAASHGYAKECSRFVSEGFSDYRD